jgi:hypothetical protein
MSAYDFRLFTLDRWTGYVWEPVEAASVSYSATYDPDRNGTLIIGSESVQIALSGYGAATLLAPLDVVQVAYDGHVVGVFTVDTTDIVTAVDSDAMRRGQVVRVSCSCSAVGTYAAAQDTLATWPAGFDEPDPILRVQHWVNIVDVELITGPG